MSEIKRDKLLTPFVERNLRLTGSRLPNAKFDSFLAVEFKENNDNKITLFAASGQYNEDNKQKSANLHLEAYSFALLCKQAEKISSQAPGFEFRGIKVNGVRKKRPGDDTKGPAHGWDGTVFIGKDQEGVCYICVMNTTVGKLKFPFRPSNWSSLVNVRTNEPASAADVSCDYAEAWSAMLLPIVATLLVNHPYDWQAGREKPNGGGWGGNGGQGGGGWNKGGQGGGQQKAPDMSFLDAPAGGGDSFDSDIPM